MKKMNKKGMGIGDLYNFVLTVVLVGMVIGVGVLALDKFSQTSSITAAANTSIVAARTEVGGIASNWLGLIVTIVVLAIVIGIVVSAFGRNQAP